MLIQNHRPGQIEASFATSFSSEITNQDSCDWVSGEEALEMSPENDERPLDGRQNSNIKNGDPCSLDSADGSRPSTFSAKSKPIVYHRKRFRRKPSVSFSTETSVEVRPSNGCPSGLCSEVHSGLVAVEKLAPIFHPVQCNGGGLLSKSNSCDGIHEGEDQCSSRSDMQRTSHLCVNDSYSSSKCDLDFGLKTNVDDTGECSSSAALHEGLHDNMTEKDKCIALLRGYGLLEKVEHYASTKDSDICPDNCHLVSCKACDGLDTTLKMLICDNCDDTYHLSCCNPRIKKVPRNEWFCRSCLNKKRKLLENLTFIGRMEAESCNNLLKATSMYRTCVRVGSDFQAEVPDWAGPAKIDEVDRSGEPLNISSPCSRGCSSNKPSTISSIGNWIQCRQVSEYIVDGSICGKWRRAPLFEVQTDDWECFRAVLWDPAHADCAVPQELETEEVLKQVKYIETLKPRLGVKRPVKRRRVD